MTQDLKSAATCVVQHAKNPVAAFSGFLDKLKPQLSLALPKHMTVDRMARLALTAFSTSPQLQNCDQKSIAASIMTAGQLGLEPGVNGAGYLIPYGKTCTFVPGWKGLVDLVSRSGRGTVFTGVIFKDQEYTFTDGARRDLVIHNETDLEAPEDITHAYAIGWVKDAAMPIIELWRVSKIKKHRDKYNKVGTKHYSFRDWEMYCRKIPLLQVLKYMPCSIEVANAIEISNASEAGRGATIENGIVIYMDDDQPDMKSIQEAEPADKYATQRAEIAGLSTMEDFSTWLQSHDKPTKTALMADLEAAQERIKSGEVPAITFAQVADSMITAGDLETLELKADLINKVADPAHREELTTLYGELRAKLE